jgi:hypothetical protein
MSDSKNQSQSLLPSLFDTVLVIGILALVGTVIFNTIRINSLNKEAEKTVAQLCWITEMVFGAPDTSMTLMEACYGLRDEIFESWEALKQ